MSLSDCSSYFMMLMGWFIVIRSSTDFIKARRLQQVIMTCPAAVEAV
jgi:hypothetical protein